jgi:acetyltransferase-like isoleucine patch superfamily enzyme
MVKTFQKGSFSLRFKYYSKILGYIRKCWWSLLGMKTGEGTVVPKLYITWPHQVHIGRNCLMESGVSFKFDGVWKKGPSIVIGDNVFIGAACEFNIRKSISIGKDTLIASGCRFIDHDHGTSLEQLMRVQDGPEEPIKLGSNVWLGYNVVVLKGVEIGDGAIVAAGAVVTKSILPNEIWAGIPARKISKRK